MTAESRRSRAAAAVAALACAVLVVLPFPAAAAAACACADAPVGERLDRADAAFVGRIVAERETTVRGVPQTLLTVDVVQRVKGGLPDRVVIRSPRGTDCDLRDASSPAVQSDGTSGLLVTRAPDGTWLGSACSVVSAVALVAAGDEPRGGSLKVVIGLGILALVLLWSFRRLKRGSRPELPGRPPS